jgi:hypothetical protein
MAIAACKTGERPDINDGGRGDPCWRLKECTPDPGGVCQHTCTPDPGPRLVDCEAAEENYEFPATFINDFEAVGMTAQATGLYSYTDNSQVIASFVDRAPDGRPILQTTDVNDAGDPLPDAIYKPSRRTYQPPTVSIGRCLNKDEGDGGTEVDAGAARTNRALHIQGGPFLSWGGGVGKAMKEYPSTKTPTTWRDAVIDASEWEGISFWARRGPDSQAGFRVLVGDKYTDDDVSYLQYREDPNMPRFCERVRECECLNHMPCTPLPRKLPAAGGGAPINNPDIPSECRPDDLHFLPSETTVTHCGAPMAISGADQAGSSSAACNTCLQTRCNERYPAYPDDYATPFGMRVEGSGIPIGTDRQFWQKPCSKYTYRNGISSSFCFDPNMGEKPAETTEQCGDHWTRVVNLSNEWQFYTVPFNTMTQQGWAKRSPGLDLTTVSVVRFTWDGGWVDFWIDDVRFYKRR